MKQKPDNKILKEPSEGTEQGTKTVPAASVVSRRHVVAGLSVVMAGTLLTGCGTLIQPGGMASGEVSTAEEAWRQSLLREIHDIARQWPEMDDRTRQQIEDQAINPLRDNEHILIAGLDQYTRPVAIEFQAMFELALSRRLQRSLVKSVTLIIHTDRPATPLCHPKGQVFADALPEAVRNDTRRLMTILNRTVTLRSLCSMAQPEFRCITAWSRGGTGQLASTERKMFEQAIADNSLPGLINMPLEAASIPPELSGATCIVTGQGGEEIVFALNGQQVWNSERNAVWQYWFGGRRHERISRHLSRLDHFLQQAGITVPQLSGRGTAV
ncbi:hypothetical protein ACWJJH_16095 [Endozoicomonadaceae bacterium StTr2]